jgi:hypothetical protein
MVYIADFGMYEVIPMVTVSYKRKFKGRRPKYMALGMGTWRSCWFEHFKDRSEIIHYELSWFAN